jgi:hypothetical protein
MECSNMEFLNLAFSFPSVILSALLFVVVIFWAITLLGFADIDMFESDVDSDVSQASSGSIWHTLGFGDAPLTVSASVLVMTSWLITIYAHKFFASVLGNGIVFYVLGGLLLLISLLVAIPISALLLRPLRRFFASKSASQSSDLLGLECVVATGKVTDSFGQARVKYQGTEQLIEVRAENNEQFSSGDTAVLLEHIKDKHCYIITAKPW